MKFPNMSPLTESVKRMSMLEMTVAAIFIIYLIFPIQTPTSLAGAIDSPIGMVSIFIVTVYLFFYEHPILAILYVFVAYELMRRSAHGALKTVQIMPNVEGQKKKDSELKAMNPPTETSLEEAVVSKMAPIGKSEASVFQPSSFQPVASNVGSASVF